jgi:hypothetical protein
MLCLCRPKGMGDDQHFSGTGLLAAAICLAFVAFTVLASNASLL